MAKVKAWREVLHSFSDMPDPRVQGRCRHDLFDIIAITIVGVTCGLDEWEDIALFGEYREEWFRTWLHLPNGIPSHDTFGRVFSLLDPKEFSTRLALWAGAVREAVGTSVIAIDGKTLCGSHDNKKGQRPLHLVSA
jgi:hypothetical protein